MKKEITLKDFFDNVVATGIRTIEDMIKKFPVEQYSISGRTYFNIIENIKKYKTLNFYMDSFKTMLLFYITIDTDFVKDDFALILSLGDSFGERLNIFRDLLLDVHTIIDDKNHEDFFTSLFSLDFMNEFVEYISDDGFYEEIYKKMIGSMAPKGFFFKDIERFLECSSVVIKIVDNYDLERCSDEVRLYLELI